MLENVCDHKKWYKDSFTRKVERDFTLDFKLQFYFLD